MSKSITDTDPFIKTCSNYFSYCNAKSLLWAFSGLSLIESLLGESMARHCDSWPNLYWQRTGNSTCTGLFSCPPI